MKILRTDKKNFLDLPDFPYGENYVEFENQKGDAAEPIRMHYLDEGEGEVILALHGEPSWCFLYRKFIPILSKNYRFIAPDLIGFGKSDKIVGWKNYTFDLHLRSLKNFVEKLDLKDITLVVQDWGGLLGLSLLGAHPELFKRVIVLNTFLPVGKPLNTFFKSWVTYAKYHPSLPVGKVIQMGSYNKLSKEIIAAYDAPFPSRHFKGGPRSFPSLVPGSKDASGVKEMKKAREVLSKWQKPALVLFSDKDRILGGLDKFFDNLIPTAKHQRKIIIKNAGHFLQEEKGEEIAGYIDQFIKGELEVG